MALTITFKRKFYNNTSNMEDAGQTAGGAIGGIYGMKTGAVAGAMGGAAIGTIGGAIGGAAEVYNARSNADNLAKTSADAAKEARSAKAASTRATNAVDAAKGAKKEQLKVIADQKATVWNNADKAAKDAAKAVEKNAALASKNAGKNALAKAGKWGLLTAGGMAIAGGLMGRSTGKDVGGAAGQAAGGLVGSASDRLVNLGNNQRQYSVSQMARNVWNSTKKYIPKSKRMKVARDIVKTDQGIHTITQAAQVSPGTVVETGMKQLGKNPLASMPGYTTSTVLLNAGNKAIHKASKGKIGKDGVVLPDSLLRNTIIGKPIYAATEYLGNTVGRILNPVTDAVYTASRTLAI